MRNRYAKTAVLSLLLLTLAGAAGAVTLWDQSVINLDGPGIAASNSPGFGGFTAHTVDDITVPGSGWVVTKITAYYSGYNPSWVGGVTQGYVNVQAKTGALPTGAVSAVLVPMTASYDIAQSGLLGQDVIAITANVNIPLSSGDYWIGITPNGAAGIFGANQMWPSATVGSPVATWLSPGPWAAIYGNYDGAFKLEGDEPVPTTTTSWGALKSLYR